MGAFGRRTSSSAPKDMNVDGTTEKARKDCVALRSPSFTTSSSPGFKVRASKEQIHARSSEDDESDFLPNPNHKLRDGPDGLVLKLASPPSGTA